MKREAFRHPKLLDLSVRLSCSRPEAIGFLQLLWDFTAEYAIQGDIGKHSNGSISKACDWTGNPDDFVRALVESGWMDEDDEYRLLVHDWADHCERWVKLKMDKIGKDFIGSSIDASTEGSIDALAKPSSSRDQSNPIQSNPIRNTYGYTDDFEIAWHRYPKRAGGNPKRPAFKAWNARLKEGIPPQDMIDGTERYANYCEATGKLNTEFVKQAKTFFGPDKHFLEDWTPPEDPNGKGRKPSALERVQQKNRDRYQKG